jgi:translation initiation factor 1 (eIF-1/SUI1)
MGNKKGYKRVVLTTEMREAMQTEYLNSPFRKVLEQITIEDLKANKEDIIHEITSLVGASNVKLAMEEMVKMLKLDYATKCSVEDYVSRVINFCGIKEEYKNTLWGNGCEYSSQSEYQRAGLGSKWNKK